MTIRSFFFYLLRFSLFDLNDVHIKGTAEAICRNIGIFDEEEDDLTGRSFTGRQFDDMSEAEKQEAAKHASLFSRTEPIHKMQLVELLQQQGEIVAMVFIFFLYFPFLFVH